MSTKGTTLIELLVAIGLMAIFLPALVSGLSAARIGKAQQAQRVTGLGLLKETEEAVRAARDNNWTNVQTNGTFHPIITGNTWVLSPGTENINGYTRSLTISDFYRGSLLDPSLKKVDITISWTTPQTTQINSTLYLVRYVNNTTVTDTTVNDFNKSGSILTAVQTSSPSHNNSSTDGQVILASGGNGNWCAPSQSVTTVDLSRQGVPTAVLAFQSSNNTGNRVFAGTGGNASGKPFTNTKITGNSPPTANALGDFNAGGLKANAVFGNENYAYFATDDKTKALTILDLNQFTNPPTNNLYLQTGVFNSGDPKNANSVFVSGNTAFLTTNKLYDIDVTNKSNPTKLNNPAFGLDGSGVKVIVVSNLAYIGISGSSTKLQIIDVSNPASPTNLGKLVNSSLGNVTDIYVDSTGNRVYLVTDNATGNNFYILNTSSKSAPSLIGGGTFSTGMNPTGVTVVSGNKAIIVGKNGSDLHPEYQVVNIGNESSISLCTTGGTGTLRVPSGINAVSSLLQSDSHAYSYIVTGDSHAELKIIEGGLGGAGTYGNSGTYESATFQFPFLPASPLSTAFNRLDISYTKPAGTDIQFQVAVTDAISNSCSGVSYTFVGPNAGTGNFLSGGITVNPFTQSYTVPFGTFTGYQNPGKCLRYRAYLSTTDNLATPVLNDVTLNYSP